MLDRKLINIAKISIQKGYTNTAIQTMESISDNAIDLDEFTDLISFCLQNDYPNTALKMLEKTGDNKIKNIKFIEGIKICVQNDYPNTALKMLEKIIDDGSRSKALAEVAEICVQKGYTNTAMKMLDKIIDDGSRSKALAEVAEICVQKGYTNTAKNALKQINNCTIQKSEKLLAIREESNIINSFKFDVFISHASEDKESLVRDLALKLSEMGLKVWFDEFTLSIGDSLRRSIDYGLANSRYGIVVLSKKFFEKEWPQKELDGLVSREDGLNKVILPIWHNISKEEVKSFSPILADRLAISSINGKDYVVNEIFKVFNK